MVGILAGVKPFEERWRDRLRGHGLRITLRRGAMSIDALKALTGGSTPSGSGNSSWTPAEDPEREVATILFTRLPPAGLAQIERKLREVAGCGDGGSARRLNARPTGRPRQKQPIGRVVGLVRRG